MTCIVSGADWLAADRRISDDDGTKSSLVKVASNPWLIAAAAGYTQCVLNIKRAVRKGAQEPGDLCEHLDKGSLALCLTREGYLFHVTNAEALRVKGLQAIGSGGDLALGWLAFDAQLGIQATREHIRRAFRFVESRRADCGGGVDIRRL